MWELINVIIIAGKPTKYVLKDVYGQTVHIKSAELKEKILKGEQIIGVKLGSDGRIVTDRRFRSSQTTNNFGTAHNNTEQNSNNTIQANPGNYTLYTEEGLKYILYNNGLSNIQPRDVVDEILNYINVDKSPKIFILHGIRRVGKTVAISSAIDKLVKQGTSKSKIISIEITSNTMDMDELIAIVSNMYNKIIFIDEITRVNGFIDKANYLADILVRINGNRVVVAGTESLAFPISAKTSLYDRAIFSRCTLIPFDEYLRLFYSNSNRNNAVRDYMTRGGTIVKTEFDNINHVEDTLSAVVISNIRFTLERNRTLISSDSELSAISSLDDALICYLIYCIVLNSVSPKKYSSFANGLVKLGNQKIQVLAEASGLAAEAFIRNKNLSQGIPVTTILKIITVLSQLNIIERLNNLAYTDESYEIVKVTDIEICTLIQALLYRLKQGRPDKEQVIGDLMENMIISQIAMYEKSDHGIDGLSVGYCKYQHGGQEFEVDCVVTRDYGFLETRAYAIEIKHGNKTESTWGRTLNHPSLPNALHVEPSNIIKYIVYNGKTLESDSNGIAYINAYDFMTNIDKWLDK